MTDDGPYAIAVVGNFSGDAATGARPRALPVDRDGLDALLRKLGSRIDLGLPFAPALEPHGFADLRPDGLIERVPELAALAAARESVSDPAAMRERLAEAGVELTGDAPASPAAPAPPASEAGLLDEILGGPGPDATAADRDVPSARSADPLFDRVVAEIVDASGSIRDPEREQRWREAIDAELAARLDAVLHHPSFREFEARWTALRQLLHTAEAADTLRVCIVDLSQEAVAAEAAGMAEPDTGAFFRAVVDPDEGLPGGEPFDCVVTDYAFDATGEDLATLAYLAGIAGRARLPILAAACGGAVRIEDASEAALAAWAQARTEASARWIGLCAPRVLLRAPYGEDGELVHAHYEERASPERTESFLWGSSAFVLARALVASVAIHGTPDAVAGTTRVEGLPLHVCRVDGEPHAVGSGEEHLTERRQQVYELMGLIPVTAIRGLDAVQILSLRSWAGPPLF